MRNIEQHNLFVNTKPGRLFLKAALPGAIGMLASAMYQTLDGVFVGRFLGSTAFAAINLAMPFVIINFSLADLIGVGSSVPISIALGEGRGEDANKIFSLAIVLIFLAGLAIGGVLFFASPLLIALMGAEGEFAAQAVMYMRTYAMLSPFTTMMFASDNFLRICGKIRTSMGLNIFMSVFGATVEFLFLAVFGFGIWAAALANCLAMMTTTMLSMLPFMSKKLALRFVRPHFSQDSLMRSAKLPQQHRGPSHIDCHEHDAGAFRRPERRFRIRSPHVCRRYNPAAHVRLLRLPSAGYRL